MATTAADLALPLQLRCWPARTPETPPRCPSPCPRPGCRAGSSSPTAPTTSARCPRNVADQLARRAEDLARLLDVPLQRWQPGDFFPGWSPDEDWFTLAAAEHASVFGRARIEQGLDQLHPSTAEFLTAGLAVPAEVVPAGAAPPVRPPSAGWTTSSVPTPRWSPRPSPWPGGVRAGRSPGGHRACSAPTSTPPPCRT